MLSLWSASRGLIGIINGLNRIHHAKENRGFIRLRLYSIIYTLLLIGVIIIILTLLIFGDGILKWADNFMEIPEFSDD
ncbi:MAG: YihY/virulence factor BrkB family protein, partial [Oscillospiraceae bacterium]|nr:YihY/virulence factor BrkB family protein [Oscillospiraceae bacterium]